MQQRPRPCSPSCLEPPGPRLTADVSYQRGMGSWYSCWEACLLHLADVHPGRWWVTAQVAGLLPSTLQLRTEFWVSGTCAKGSGFLLKHSQSLPGSPCWPSAGPRDSSYLRATWTPPHRLPLCPVPHTRWRGLCDHLCPPWPSPPSLAAWPPSSLTLARGSCRGHTTWEGKGHAVTRGLCPPSVLFGH